MNFMNSLVRLSKQRQDTVVIMTSASVRSALFAQNVIVVRENNHPNGGGDNSSSSRSSSIVEVIEQGSPEQLLRAVDKSSKLISGESKGSFFKELLENEN
jgi:energy-coupling factor transporter ATP-binding protein EcfA2